MRVSVASIVSLGVLGAGCGGGLTTVNQLPATVTLRIGQEVQLTSPEVMFRLDEVVQDSRCPVDAVCIQAGSVTLKFLVTHPSEPAGFELILDSDRPDGTTGVVLRVTGVTPVPRVGITIDPEDYRVSLEIAPLIAPA